MKKILLIDNFDSFTFNLVDYFKRLNCEVAVYRNDVDPAIVEKVSPDLIVFSPGPSVPANAGNMMAIIRLYHEKYPMFGVCLGHEAFIEFFGGNLKFVTPVHGRSSEIEHDGKTIFKGLPQNFLAGRYHSLCADTVPECFTVSAKCGDLAMAVRHRSLPIEGVQFHPESVLTMKGGNGFKIIENVVKGLIGGKEGKDSYFGRHLRQAELGRPTCRTAACRKLSDGLPQEQTGASVQNKNPFLPPKTSKIINFLNDSIQQKISVKQQVSFLEKYTPEKVTAEDLKIFVDFMLKNMSGHLNMSEAIDICGTGGSGLARINTSTISAFLLSDLGVGIAKHGNKAASGRVGSFDLLEELGEKIEKSAEELEKDYAENNLAFIYARNFHPAMKYFAEARRIIGKPTIFNLLGPSLNPANVQKQIIGTSFKNQMRLLAKTCHLLGKKHVLIVRGEDGLDEVTLTGKTKIVEMIDGKIMEYEISPKDFGIKKCNFEEMKGGDKKFNTNIALEILEGRCKSRHADLVYVNCALALKLAGKVSTLKKGYEMAKNGNILKRIARSKNLRCSPRSFLEALKKEELSIIAEVKKASPSGGKLFKGKFNPVMIAREYERAGASAISVLTDEKYFQGSFEYLRKVSGAVVVPVLCKDFIVNEYQIYKAREYGADAILLIAALLPAEKLKKFLQLAGELQMDCLVEVHNEKEVKEALSCEAKIIGINNRDLKNFEIDLDTTNRLCKLIPGDKIIVSESGINSREDVLKLDKKVDAVLIGTAFMKAKNITKKFNEITI